MKGYKIGRGNDFILGRNRQHSRLEEAGDVMRYEAGESYLEDLEGASLPPSSLGDFLTLQAKHCTRR